MKDERVGKGRAANLFAVMSQKAIDPWIPLILLSFPVTTRDGGTKNKQKGKPLNRFCFTKNIFPDLLLRRLNIFLCAFLVPHYPLSASIFCYSVSCSNPTTLNTKITLHHTTPHRTAQFFITTYNFRLVWHDASWHLLHFRLHEHRPT